MIEATLVLSILALGFALLSIWMTNRIAKDLYHDEIDIQVLSQKLSTKQDLPYIPTNKTYRTYRQGVILHIVDPYTKSCIICDETEEWIDKRLNEG